MLITEYMYIKMLIMKKSINMRCLSRILSFSFRNAFDKLNYMAARIVFFLSYDIIIILSEKVKSVSLCTRHCYERHYIPC